MNMNELISTTPISVEKSTRLDEIRNITSCQAGKIVPLAFVPLLREDSVSRGELRISFNMSETLHPLLNSVNVKVMAHFVSYLAFDRFDGFDSFNRSYQGIPEPSTGTPIPFFGPMTFLKAAPFWKTLGVQWPEGTNINSALVEAYNVLVNFRRRARTDKLPVRTVGDTTLAEAFWKNSPFSDVVPDWDQAANEGVVPVDWAISKLAVQGIGGTQGAAIVTQNNVDMMEVGPDGIARNRIYPHAIASTEARIRLETLNTGLPSIFADLSAAGVTLSLANIELAKQTAAFAKLRERFDGIDDDHIIDLLMEGIRVPDEAMKQPILLDSRSTIFGMQERHAMDGDNLDLSRTTGQTTVGLRFRTPPMNTGGIILVTAEIVPEQLYERQWDASFSTDVNQLPNFMRDYLDPEKVIPVLNRAVDVHHAQPSAVFGYAPLNSQWKRNHTKAGGKFYRPNPDTFVEDRMRFWSADQTNPTLADDFYMVSDLPNTVFADTVSDPFEVVTLGQVAIVGNTVFGDRLTEDTGSYEEIMDQVPTDRITQVPIPPATLEGDEVME